jgi:hypothetical protein
MLTGIFSKQFQSQQVKKALFKSADCLGNFGIVSISDGNYCHNAGSYNSNNWVV